jgi:hypothetical protein
VGQNYIQLYTYIRWTGERKEAIYIPESMLSTGAFQKEAILS